MSTAASKKKFITFQGHSMFRMRIVLSLLTGEPIRIHDIRWDHANPGITESEASFLQLVDKLTNNTHIEINEAGTVLKFRPGTLVGGGPHQHKCEGEMGIGWFLEALVCVLPFAKKRTTLTLMGITNEDMNPSVDAIRTVTLPLLRRFAEAEQWAGLELRVVKRGASPLGGGEITLVCPTVNSTVPVSLCDEGKIKRVRGIAFSTRVSPQLANRVVESARGILNQFLPDVYIYTDHSKGEACGLSPGFGVVLVAESNTGVNIASEVVAVIGKNSTEDSSPEAIGERAAMRLCENISLGGCVDPSNQFLAILMMAFGPEDVSVVRMGKLTEYSVEVLRLVKEMAAVKFKIKPAEGNTVLMSCLGCGASNLAKART